MANGSRTFREMAMAATMCLAVAATPAPAQGGLARLEAYNVDPSQVSVSGASSGGMMAIQLGVAYSSRIMGVAVFSAAPYDCMRVYSPARIPGHPEDDYCTGLFTPDLAPLLANMHAWSGRQIDPLGNLARQRIFIFEGTSDSVVGPNVVAQLVKQYAQFVPASNLHYEFSVPAGHTFPTDFDNPYSNSRSSFCIAVGFFMANCGYDGAGAELQWIYGPLNPRTPGLPDGNLLSVNQGEFVARSKGMDEHAFLYVPKSCAAGTRCRLHLFLHGCRASYFQLGDAFFANYSGHSRWAETNDIILLFPQTYPYEPVDIQGCWDTNGTYDDEFDQKGGAQTSAIMAMVARITSGYQGPAKAIEYRHAGFDHYFVTSDADEISKLDNGTFVGWARTGESFAVAAVNSPGASNVCRFFSISFGAKSSHFYTADASECETVKRNPDWQFEGLVFALNAPDATGNCAAGAQPLYRLYNNGQGGAPNHRYTTSLAIHATMTSAGWISEGVRGCTPP